MFPPPNTPARNDEGFERAYRRARRGRLFLRFRAWMRRCCSRAERAGLGFSVCLGEEWNEKGGVRRLGLREVEVREISGSVGRCRDFDRGFMPLRRGLEERWNGVCRALCAGAALPPVSLYKLGETYFVRDGNHRVSVSRYRGVRTIDAEVVELTPDSADD